MFTGCEEILDGCTVESRGGLRLISGPRAEGYGLEVWQDGRLVELFLSPDEGRVRERAREWFGDGGCVEDEMTPHDLLLFTTSHKQWWSEHCDPAPGRDG